MRWLPEHGVAIIAMGNLTYTSWGRVTEDALDALARTGGLKPRMPQPSPALLAARAAVNRLIDRWDDAEAEAIAADNLFLDAPAAARRAAGRGHQGAGWAPAAPTAHSRSRTRFAERGG